MLSSLLLSFVLLSLSLSFFISYCTSFLPSLSPSLSQMLMTDSATHELSAAQFAVWMTEHCPRLLEGLQHWIETLLHGDHTDDDKVYRMITIILYLSFSMYIFHSSFSFLILQSMHTQYQLPCPKLEDGMEEADMHLLVWALSTIVPLAYLGHRSHESFLQVKLSK